MQVKMGSRLRSAVCSTEVIVVRAPSSDVGLTCGGAPMLAPGEDGPTGAELDLSTSSLIDGSATPIIETSRPSRNRTTQRVISIAQTRGLQFVELVVVGAVRVVGDVTGRTLPCTRIECKRN